MDFLQETQSSAQDKREFALFLKIFNFQIISSCQKDLGLTLSYNICSIIRNDIYVNLSTSDKYRIGPNLDGPNYGRPFVGTALIMDDFTDLYIEIRIIFGWLKV